ncbi:hypothetical protein Dsin_014407 [Dipteronia sinensis]|uniref:ERAP1-like C-terminal domain-containing protein n=1 Tax=Dipteronia sinensis TaxID=43782 RepID=A0AAE0AMY7_9ROSI|nr:hypothetical protein Dsin_014407 [Dipteronia sinensis]
MMLITSQQMRNSSTTNRNGFESLLKFYRDREVDAMQEKERILQSLALSPDPDIVLEVLNFLVSDEVRDQDISYGLVGLSLECRETAWRWLKENWDRILKKYGSGMLLHYFVREIVTPLSSDEKAEEVEAFFGSHVNPAVDKILKQSIERIRIKASTSISIIRQLQDQSSNHDKNMSSSVSNSEESIMRLASNYKRESAHQSPLSEAKNADQEKLSGGSLKIAKALVRKNAHLPQMANNLGNLPLFHSIIYSENKELMWYLTLITRVDSPSLPKIIRALTESGSLDIALYFIQRYPNYLALDKDGYDDSLLQWLSTNPSYFFSGSNLGLVERWIYKFVHVEIQNSPTAFINGKYGRKHGMLSSISTKKLGDSSASEVQEITPESY